jgi:mannose-6-phosphate isomerase
MSSPAPLRLRPDNFTPATRTPWGGTRIRSVYKAALGLAAGDAVVGESWEISVEPSFPSRVEGSAKTLSEHLAEAPAAWLGEAVAARFGGQTPLLVKLLDAASHLSVQVHPADDDPALAPGESGKPEAWIVLDAAPGAGLYLGFRDGVSQQDVARCLADGGAMDALMSFVPVTPGDAFVIAAGTAHAIGAGVTLIEPQLVTPGRRGLTYRFWDWNRRYDANGQLDPRGKARDLHVERSLAVTDFTRQGDALVAACRSLPKGLGEGPVTRRALVDWPFFVCEEWRGTGRLDVPAAGTLLALTCTRGSLEVTGRTGTLRLRCGESGVVPAVAGALAAVAEDAVVFATRSPSGA